MSNINNISVDRKYFNGRTRFKASKGLDVMEYDERVKIIKEVWGEKSSDAIKMLDVIYAHEEDHINPSDICCVFGEDNKSIAKALDFIRYFCGDVQKLLKYRFWTEENGKNKLIDNSIIIELMDKKIYTHNGKDITISFEITKDAAWNV